MTSEAKNDLVAQLKPVAWRAVKALRYSLGWTVLADALSEYITAAASLAEQVEELTRDNEILTKGGIIEVAIRNFSVAEYVNHWEGRTAKAESALTLAEADNVRLRAENEKMRELVQQAFRDGVIYGTNIADADPDLAWEYSRARAVLSNTNEGGKDE